ncbi:Inactive serine/threonine-protein kinase TEX14 [Dufourea novaeangliae]|uniref:Inactive serine/threonine-protein kinase TEX14 n=1 Tax=Dufourea novaeangliae TaxID=178035 RepID=A0A154PTX3_DUFNO|nr:Inactive serine/threonine-protein kinase TEX14 [Dufourea novaeangliae]
MGMMGMFKWLRKDIVQRERNGWNLAQKQCGLNNESYRNAIQAFIDRRRCSDDVDPEAPCSPDKTRADLVAKNNNNKYNNERKSQESKTVLRSVPYVPASEIFEIGWIAGTEDRYLELIFAEWQNTRVSLKRHIHPECKDAVKADLDVLLEIPHPNVLLLMGITNTDDHGLVTIFESVDCTLYHYIHEQGERISILSIAKCVGRLSDALRHSHVLGYVHSAISSHCVYLASSGVVKLGGWELAMHLDNPKVNREYEERLRNEIFRWQAPELFESYEPRKESDVYGLAMLIWEMCTMQVPWRGYSKADVERQYAQRKRGVIMYLYDFPPLLHNLLEAGLQLDVEKRTLDMNRMRRFLQRLEMQYEDEEPMYVDHLTNNNNETGKTYVLPVTRSTGMSKSKGAKLTKSVSAKQLYSANTSESPTSQYIFAKQLPPKQNGNTKTGVAHIEPINIFAEDVRRGGKDNAQKNTNILFNKQNNYKKSNCSYCTSEMADAVRNEETNSEENLRPWNITYKRVKAPQESADSWVTSLCSPPLMDSTDDETYKDARTNLKQLKKALADKREHFFYGSDSSQSSYPSPRIKNKILTQTKSRDYEPHKPASHKTSLEPRYNKSPGQYDSSCMKSSCHQYRKIPYSHVPVPIKDAIAQPQVLNSDPKTFFETSLWRKEKLICLAKMRKSCGDESAHYEQSTDDNTIVSSATFTKNTTMNSNSPKRGDTYVLHKKTQVIKQLFTETETSQEGYSAVSEDVNDSSGNNLQVLKDALDRATKIVRSVTPNSDVSCPSPPFKTYANFEITVDDSQTTKSIFEDLYNLQENNVNEEIKTIERSTRDDTFLFSKDIGQATTRTMDTNEEVTRESENEVTTNITNDDNPTHSFETTYTRNFVCESIAEVSSEFNSSYNDIKADKTSYSNTNITIEDLTKSSEHAQGTPSTTEQNDAGYNRNNEEDERRPRLSNFNLMFLNDSAKNKNCNSCHQSALPRRRSLPAALSQLRLTNNSALGKLPIRRGGVPDNTVEDLYIDDEFGDSLNVNMVLLDEDLSIDEDFLPDLSDLDIIK